MFTYTGDMVTNEKEKQILPGLGTLVSHDVLERDAKFRFIPLLPSEPLRMLGTVEAGFPSPAEESLADNISLDDLLIQNREASFLIKVSGDSMTGAGIMPGDMVIVDRGQVAKSGDIVIAEVDGEWTMKYFRKQGKEVVLEAANPKYPLIRPRQELKLGGIVTAVIRKYHH